MSAQTPRVHHAPRRRGSWMAARGAREAARSDATHRCANGMPRAMRRSKRTSPVLSKSLQGWARPCSGSRSPASIRLDVGVLHHLLPYAELNLDESCQFLRRAGKSLESHVLEPRLDVRAVDDLAQRCVEFLHNRRRRAGRRYLKITEQRARDLSGAILRVPGSRPQHPNERMHFGRSGLFSYGPGAVICAAAKGTPIRHFIVSRMRL